MTTCDRDATPPEIWRDVSRPADERVADLLARLTPAEKIAQLYGIWVGADANGGGVAPYQHDLADEPVDWPALIVDGLGHLTRPLGTAPVEPDRGAAALAAAQAEIVAAGRFGIPAIAHEECLSGFTTWGATVYPTPLAWGASFDAELVEQVAARIGTAMRSVGVHQGLAPVLDVVRDPRWGRTEETIGEDPHLVTAIGTGYVRGLQSAGVIATLKHFAGYSASRAGRNLAPVPIGPRELADVILPPFEAAVRLAGAGSVMHSYTELDGMPVAADPALLTDLLRDRWGFTGTVVADYFGVSFLQTLHGVAADPAEAAALALAAGVDIELPTVRCYGAPLRDALAAGRVPEHLIDRAARRVLTQKCTLGLLDPDWRPTPPALDRDRAADGAGSASARIDLDGAADRQLARRLAEESVVLLRNAGGALPLPPAGRIAVVGPNADDPRAMLGCYSFPNHVGVRHPGLPLGIPVEPVLGALRAELPDATIGYAHGCGVDTGDDTGLGAAAALAADADVCVAVLGDRAGLFGRGTSGEGCDVAELRLPGIQQELLAALVATGTPVVALLLAGRPYALGELDDRLAARVQAFFPGAEGGPAIAGVLSGRVCPSGRTPVSVPHLPGGQPTTYLAPPLGHRTEVSSIDPTPRYPFGHGLSYTRFRWSDVLVDGRAPGTEPVRVATDGAVRLSVLVRNVGDRAGTEVVQLYLHDPVAEVTRPVVRLVGSVRVPLAPGGTARAEFTVPAEAAAYPGRDLYRLVEPGELELRLSASSADHRHTVALRLTGPRRRLDDRLPGAVLARVEGAP
ncbi:beta-glucosidase [Actinocatenispora thailandica]|uniref:Beta-glucosidase n=1 Tax=Actinocatenispora thailandica TaxID=227318 RepID=A0A7R7HWR4_9ACTN|nr:glycoside hydrolase family 3 N-terminal domain-containing protein [Actinocatenispora thailandica]BCJ34358.1 beta-glucosidase [Actinocatenispora thailandica]